MAHFANVVSNQVVSVVVVPDEREQDGELFLNSVGLPGMWVQTSYNSRRGKRINPETGEEYGDHFRYNFAGPGYIWDSEFGENGAFIPPRPDGMESWVVNPDEAAWEPPVPMPTEVKDEDGNDIYWLWDEGSVSWVMHYEDE